MHEPAFGNYMNALETEILYPVTRKRKLGTQIGSDGESE
jgi:hypothetical protein